jgi:diguanylate cyclase (GGDEF)-like protein
MGSGKSRIGRRIILLVFFSVVLSLMTVTSAVTILHFQEEVAARKAGIQATGYVFASAIADSISTRDQQGALSVLRSISRVPDITYAVAVDGSGRPIASLGETALLESDLANDSGGMFQLLTRASLPVKIDIIKSSEVIGQLVLLADITGLRWQLARAALLTLLAALVAGVVGVLAAIRLKNRITEPLMSLTRAMADVRKARDYSVKVEHKSDDETGILVDSFNSMMSEINYRDRALKQLAYFDPLTGLANRQEFQRQLDAVLAGCSDAGEMQAALFLLDLDEFKSINDSYGHSAGDALLVTVAAGLKQIETDGISIARLGGDEFAVIAGGVTSEARAMQLLESMLQSFSQPVEIMGRLVEIKVSAGIAMLPRDGRTSSDLLRRADLALYAAKRGGKGRMEFFRPPMDEEAQLRTSLAIDLRRAIREDQLEVHYQPQVDIHSGVVDGFESLMRWKHPARGYVPPDLFISVAESNGLICDLGHWILRESCRQARQWLDEGVVLRQISVNVSVAQIRQADFHYQVENVLAETRLPAYILCLEVTESLFAGISPRQVRQMLESLKAIGVTLAIDDFGTGYSSLSYLLGLPFDKLKIDRAFVSDIENDADKRRLLSGVIDLGHALDLMIVAEGAETPGEVNILREMQADMIQGYVFSRPLPAHQVVGAAAAITRDFDQKFPLVPLSREFALHRKAS